MKLVNQRLFAGVSAFILAGTIAGCSNSDKKGGGTPLPGPPETSSYQFTIDKPDYSSLVDSTLGNMITEKIAGLFIQKAFADEMIRAEDIHVVMIDAAGVIKSIMALDGALTQTSTGINTLELPGEESVDQVIVVNLHDDSPDIKVGDTVTATNYLFMPTVESTDSFKIDLGSSVAMGLFLEQVGDFENITVEELDNIIDESQLLLKDFTPLSTSLEDMISEIKSRIHDKVVTLSQLALLTKGTKIPDPNHEATIEDDRKTIKSFFNDVNTLYVLSGDLTNKDDDGALDKLANNSKLTFDVIEQSDRAFDALTAISQDVYNYYQAMESIPDKTVSITPADIFGDSPQARDLQGTIEYSQQGLLAKIQGSYDNYLFVSGLSIKIATDSDKQSSSMTVSGTLESNDAKLVVNNGRLSVSGIKSNRLLTSKNGEQIDEYIKGVTQVLLQIDDIELTGKGVKEGTNGVYTGSLGIDVIRSKNDFIPFVGAKPRPFYNLKEVTLKGRFAFIDDSFSVDATFSSDNADTFVSETQQYTEGDIEKDLISYDYNGVNSLNFHYPNGRVEIKGSEKNTRSLFIKNEDPVKVSSNETLRQYIDSIANIRFNVTVGGDYRWLSVETKSLEMDGKRHKIMARDTANRDEKVEIFYTFNKNQLVLVDEYNVIQAAFEVMAQGNKTDIYRRSSSHEYAGNYSSFDAFVTSSYNSRYFYDSSTYARYKIPADSFQKGVIKGTVQAVLDTPWEYPADASETISLTYTYTDDFLTVSYKDQVKTLELDTIVDYKVLNIEKTRFNKGSTYVDTNNNIGSSLYNKRVSFSDYVKDPGTVISSGSYFIPNERHGVSYKNTLFNINGKDIEVTAPDEKRFIDAEVADAKSLVFEESDDYFRLLSGDVNVKMNLPGLGETQLAYSMNRTGYDDLIITMAVNHIDNSKLSTRMDLFYAIVDGELDEAVISNSSGIQITKSQVEDNMDKDEAWDITYGLEVATLEVTSLGLKLTLSDGSFTLY